MEMDNRTRRLVNGVIVVCVLAIVAAIVIGILAGKTRGLNFTVMFDDAQGLPVGAPVTLRGLRVGEVTRVELAADKQHIDVDLSIRPEYSQEIPGPDSVTARIRRSLVLPGNHVVSLVLMKDASGQMPEGERIIGVDNWVEEKRFLARGMFQRAYDAAVDKTIEKVDAAKAWWTGREERKEKERIREEMLEWLDAFENLNAESTAADIKALRLKAELLAQRWREEGHIEEAQKIEDIAASMQAVESAEQAAPTSPTQAPSPQP